MKLQPEPFAKIKFGKKTIELRLYDEKRRKINIGDQIEFLNLNDKKQKIRVQVTELYKYSSFEELYDNLPLSKCGYEDFEIECANSKDMEKYYTVDDQKKDGVIGIEIKLLDWKNSDLIKTSRYISLILRHKPQAAGITLDNNGWAKVDDLIEGVGKTHYLTMEVLEEIVRTDDKQRYSFNSDKSLIRANQGHSIPVDVELEILEPPEYLYHGTGEKYKASIDEQGLIGKSRLYVHLSTDYSTAMSVGARHGTPIVYKVNTKQMHDDGFVFYHSVNNVWLTEKVPPKYLNKSN